MVSDDFPSTETRTPCLVVSVFVVLVPVRILMPCFVSDFFQRLRDLCVFDRQNVRQHFDQRHLCAEGVVKISKLYSDRPRSNDDHVLRLRLENHGFAAADDRLAVKWQARQGSRNNAGCDQNLLVVWVSVFPSVRFTNTSPGLFDRGFAADVINLVFLKQELDTRCVFIRHIAGALDYLAPIKESPRS